MEKRTIVQKEKKHTGRTVIGIILVLAFVIFFVVNEYGEGITEKYNEKKEIKELEKQNKSIVEEKEVIEEKEIILNNNQANLSDQQLNVLTAIGSSTTNFVMLIFMVIMGIIFMRAFMNAFNGDGI